jgi:hypothetical protein
MPRQDVFEVVRRLVELHVVEVVKGSVNLRIVGHARCGSWNTESEQNQDQESEDAAGH